MTINKLFLAASLGLVLAACAGEQADTAAIDAPAAGEMPQAGDQGVVTGSPEENVLGDNAATTGDASTLGDPMNDPMAPAPVTDPALDPAPVTDPELQALDENDSSPPSQ